MANYRLTLSLDTGEKSNTPFSYMLCLLFKKNYRELSLERALGEDTGHGDFSFLSSSPLGQVLMHDFMIKCKFHCRGE